MIVKGFKEIKKYLPTIEMKGLPEVFDDAISIAQDNVADEILGLELEQQLEKRDEKDSKLLVLVQRIIAVQTFLSAIPEMDLVLTDAGFAVISNQDMAPASKDRVQALISSLKLKLDACKDKLILFLMSNSDYDSWRGTEQFAKLSDGLILTYDDFKEVGVLNKKTEALYPHSWSDFFKLNSALNVALMTDVSSYISSDFAEEILEKIRDKEHFTAIERKVIKLVKIAIAAIAMGDRELGIDQAIKATAIMRANEKDFPTFHKSKEAAELKIQHADTPIFSMF